tara:strand:+ start:833 stop:1183 length:351 start_codon:yes stop_codon:yes gene_type:complete
MKDNKKQTPEKKKRERRVQGVPASCEEEALQKAKEALEEVKIDLKCLKKEVGSFESYLQSVRDTNLDGGIEMVAQKQVDEKMLAFAQMQCMVHRRGSDVQTCELKLDRATKRQRVS